MALNQLFDASLGRESDLVITFDRDFFAGGHINALAGSNSLQPEDAETVYLDLFVSLERFHQLRTERSEEGICFFLCCACA